MHTDSTLEGLDGIAIIGLSGRFPGAETITQFWQNLAGGVESIARFTKEEMLADGSDMASLQHPHLVPVTPILNDIETFDASFFGYTPKEAEIMDPQHRIFLECAWEALENAGYVADTHPGWIGVFGGVSFNGYLLNNLLPNGALEDQTIALQLATANDRDYVTTRVSYKLNLKGPSVNVQSACSTAMVAVHLACQSLLSYQCDVALAGGASVRVPQKGGYFYQEGGMYSRSGHVRAFDASADGTVFGSGAGVIVLKRLDEAIQDRDHIYAVIRGSAINNDGGLKVGFTAPAIAGQVAVLNMAQQTAGVHPETISYIEAHGTGTLLGDPIEVGALTEVFHQQTTKTGFCAIGSVKTNIGHAGAAAGAASLVKTILALKHRQLPPSLNFESPNPKIDWARSPFFVNTELRPWTGPTPLRAGVSSFGVGGTNAHAILEEAPEIEPSGPSRKWQLLALSARSEVALDAATANLVQHLTQHPDQPLADIAYTLQVGRKAFSHRRIVVCRSHDDAIAALEGAEPGRVLSRQAESTERSIVFMFSGQGAQYVNMARDLYLTERHFREVVDRCAVLLKPRLGLNLRDVLFPSPGQEDVATQQLTQTAVTQPALFVIEYALAQLWMTWGITPQAMIGHSIGEYVAATLAGVFSLEDALTLVAARGRLMQSLPPGAMVSVALSEHALLAMLQAQGIRGLSLAAINGPTRCVVSGPETAVAELEQRLQAQDVDYRRLHTSHAFHSPMMTPILTPFREQFAKITLHAPRLPFISNVTGTWITDEEATDPNYWTRHLREAVRFADGVERLLLDAQRILLEVGPGQTLSTFARQHPAKGPGHSFLTSLRHPNDPQPDDQFLLTALGQLWLAGAPVAWPDFTADERRARVVLPTYPFERQRFWVDPPNPADKPKTKQAALYKQPNLADWFYIPSWKRSMPPVGSGTNTPMRWLIFADDCGFGATLAQRLQSQGHTVVVVAEGPGFNRTGEHAYWINPARREDYDALLEALRARELLPERIVHGWNLTPSDYTPLDMTLLADAEERSFYSLLYLAQAIGQLNLIDHMHIGVLANNMLSVTSEPILNPEKALLLGPCKVIPQEFPNLSVISVDLQLPTQTGALANALADRLIAELATPANDLMIAYRGYDRWVRSYEATPLETAIPGQGRLREGGVYLITGGLGGIGLVVAEYLAQTVRARLVLVSRSSFPARDTWDHWLETNDPDTSVSQKIHKLRKIEVLGAEVLVTIGDVSNPDQMHSLIDETYARFGALHGVIHAAGIAGSGVIQLKTREVAGKVLTPKTRGTRTLEALLADKPLDFIVLCSSTISVLGGFGQVDYCAGNSFLDVFAPYYMQRYGTFVVSINWDAWLEVGMAVNMAQPETLKERQAYAGYQQLDHPLVQYWLEESPTEQWFMTKLDPAQHWVLAEHSVAGVPALPATSYLEFARAALTHNTSDTPVELQNVFFLVPLQVNPDEQTEIHAVLIHEGDTVEFRVQSKTWPKDAEAARWQDHAFGKIARIAPSAPRSYDLAAIRERCNVKGYSFKPEEFIGTGNLVSWGARWNSLRQVYVGAGEVLGELELPAEFVSDLDQYLLHPALLDVATAFAMSFHGDGTYLPFSYGRLTLHRPLTGRIYSHARYRASHQSDKELLAFDLTIMDERGNELVEIANFTAKRVSQPQTQAEQMTVVQAFAQTLPDTRPGTQLRQVRPPASTQQPKSLAWADLPAIEGITPVEGVEALMRVLTWNSLPQIIVCTRDLHGSIEQRRPTKNNLLEQLNIMREPKTLYARPDIDAAYVAPRNEAERLMTMIWQAVLGIEQVGVYDNFFDLGGDSVLSIQIIARAGDVGISITPAQIFQHQTIAGIVGELSAKETLPDDGAVTANLVPLTPRQHWLLEHNLSEAQHLRLDIPAHVRRDYLMRAIEHVVQAHEALHMSLSQDGTDWQQRLNPEIPPSVEYRDLSALPAIEQQQIQEQAASAGAERLHLDKGIAVHAALFDLGPDVPARLLISAHPLALDSVSWRVLLKDLSIAYQQILQAQPIQLPSTPTTFAQWAKRLSLYAQSDALQQEQDYWLAPSHALIPPLPRDLGPASNNSGAANTVTVLLDIAATSALQATAQTYRNTIEELLLVALLETTAAWTGSRALLLDLESTGRAGNFMDVDLQHTVGACAAGYPLLLDLRTATAPDQALQAIKEQRRTVPRDGIGYGVLRYINPEPDLRAVLAAQPRAEISFAYADELLPPSAPFSVAGPVDLQGSSAGVGSYLIEIRAQIVAGQLHVVWIYDAHQLSRATVEQLAASLLDAIQALMSHTQISSTGGFSPLDFPEAGLSQSMLDELMSSLEGELS